MDLPFECIQLFVWYSDETGFQAFDIKTYIRIEEPYQLATPIAETAFRKVFVSIFIIHNKN